MLCEHTIVVDVNPDAKEGDKGGEEKKAAPIAGTTVQCALINRVVGFPASFPANACSYCAGDPLAAKTLGSHVCRTLTVRCLVTRISGAHDWKDVKGVTSSLEDSVALLTKLVPGDAVVRLLRKAIDAGLDPARADLIAKANSK